MRKIAVFLFVLLSIQLSAQEQDTLKSYSLSLEEAIVLGLQNNYSSRRSQKDIEKALKQKWEIISQGLPQLTGNVDYQNFLKQPVTLIPAEIAGGEPGTFTPVRFGTKQSLNAAATWNRNERSSVSPRRSMTKALLRKKTWSGWRSPFSAFRTA